MRSLLLVVLVACGGGSGEVEGDPLIQTTLIAQFDNKAWTPAFGFGRTENANFTFFVGAQKISCADDFDGKPREGNYAAVNVAAPPMVGTSSQLIMNMIDVTGGELKSNLLAGGSVQVTAVTDTDVSAVFAFDSTVDGKRSAISGAVTMLRCP
jgi:hypothetical protein